MSVWPFGSPSSGQLHPTGNHDHPNGRDKAGCSPLHTSALSVSFSDGWFVAFQLFIWKMMPVYILTTSAFPLPVWWYDSLSDHMGIINVCYYDHYYYYKYVLEQHQMLLNSLSANQAETWPSKVWSYSSSNRTASEPQAGPSSCYLLTSKCWGHRVWALGKFRWEELSLHWILCTNRLYQNNRLE